MEAKPEHWAVRYIGMPYKLGARGPEFYDCFGLFRAVYKEQFGIDVPEWPELTTESAHQNATVILKALEAGDWIPSLQPFEGAAVAMSQGLIFHHVGVYFVADGGKVLHAYSKMGVIASTFRELGYAGFKNIKFYRHRLWPTS